MAKYMNIYVMDSSPYNVDVENKTFDVNTRITLRDDSESIDGVFDDINLTVSYDALVGAALPTVLTSRIITAAKEWALTAYGPSTSGYEFAYVFSGPGAIA